MKACPQAWQIEAVLPFPQKEYLEDFQKSASGDGRDVSSAFHEGLKRAATVTRLPEARPDDRGRSYADAGGYLLRQVDMLIAVWDGRPPKPGGTGARPTRPWTAASRWSGSQPTRIANLA